MLLQPITVPFSKSTLKPSVYTLTYQQARLQQNKPFFAVFNSWKALPANQVKDLQSDRYRAKC